MYSGPSSPLAQYPLAPKLEELGRRRLNIDHEELEWSRLAAEVAASGEHQKYGFFNPVDWLRVTFGMGEGMVRDRITVGRQLDRLSLAVAALEKGEIGFAHLVVLARTAEALKDRPIDEAKLLLRARAETVNRFHYTCESYRHAEDAAGVAAEAEELHEKARAHDPAPAGRYVHDLGPPGAGHRQRLAGRAGRARAAAGAGRCAHLSAAAARCGGRAPVRSSDHQRQRDREPRYAVSRQGRGGGRDPGRADPRSAHSGAPALRLQRASGCAGLQVGSGRRRSRAAGGHSCGTQSIGETG